MEREQRLVALLPRTNASKPVRLPLLLGDAGAVSRVSGAGTALSFQRDFHRDPIGAEYRMLRFGPSLCNLAERMFHPILSNLGRLLDDA